MHYEYWWCKKSATPPALRSLLPTDQALQMNIKLSHHVAIMWENCVIGNPPELNPCEYGWERNEGKSHWDLPSLQTHHVDSTLKRRGNGRFRVVSTWNPRGVFVGMLPTGIEIAPDEILQATRCKCVSTQCNKNKCSYVRAGLNCSEFCDG